MNRLRAPGLNLGILLLLLVLSIASMEAVSAQSSREAVSAQSSRKLASEPIVLMRSNKLNARSMIAYVTELNRELQIGQGIEAMLSQESVQDNLSTHPEPMIGQMVFMVQGLVPGVEAISFSQVTDEADFERLVKAGSNGAESMSVDVKGGDGKFQKTISNSWREDITDQPSDEERTEPSDQSSAQGEPAAPVGTVTVQVGVSSSAGPSVNVSGTRSDFTIVEENGRRYREHRFSFTQYYRYHDGFMFSSTYPDLHTIDLPSGEKLLGAGDQGLDAELEFFPDLIPAGFKHLFWNTISATASTGLQQLDEEDPVDYAVRRSAGDLGLATLQTVLFDTDMVSGQLTLAAADRPVSGELKLQARKNSNFSKRLGELASARSRFGPILNDDSAFTLHAAIQMPDSAQKLTTALGEWIRVQLMNAANRDAALVIAGSELKTTLDNLAAHRNLEFLLKVGWSESSGGVIYGGVQADSNPHLLQTLFDLLTSDEIPEDVADRVGLIQHGELKLIQIQIPDAGDEIPIRISHIFLAHASSCLWFAAGGENAHEILRSSIEKCDRSDVLTRTPVLTARLDLNRWMSWPTEDPTGIARLPGWADGAISNLHNQFSPVPDEELNPEVTFHRPRADDELLQKITEPGTAMRGDLILNFDESGFVLRGELGRGIGRYLVARWIIMMERLVLGSQIQQTDNSPAVLNAPAEVTTD